MHIVGAAEIDLRRGWPARGMRGGAASAGAAASKRDAGKAICGEVCS